MWILLLVVAIVFFAAGFIKTPLQMNVPSLLGLAAALLIGSLTLLFTELPSVFVQSFPPDDSGGRELAANAVVIAGVIAWGLAFHFGGKLVLKIFRF